jgi:hypothetical protein
MYGVVLTNTDLLSSYIARLKRHNFTLAKVITKWGLGRQWNSGDIHTLTKNMPVTIVRTVNGDPSYSDPMNYSEWYLHPEKTLEEVTPWLQVKPDMLIELGNEPDVVWDSAREVDEQSIWVYRYFLLEAIDAIKEQFPHAKFIAPSPRITKFDTWYRWVEIMHDALAKCDYLSAHIYGYHNLTLDNRDKADFYHIQPLYDHLFPRKPVIITECGIHDATQSAAQKLTKYNEFYLKLPEHWKGMAIYHYNYARDIDPEYAVLP